MWCREKSRVEFTSEFNVGRMSSDSAASAKIEIMVESFRPSPPQYVFARILVEILFRPRSIIWIQALLAFSIFFFAARLSGIDGSLFFVYN